LKYCVYNQNIIDYGILRHYKQFLETRDGDRLPIFPDNRAIIEIDIADRYKVCTTNGEVLFIGTGFEGAIRRIYFAQPYAEIEIIANGRRLTLEEYEQERESGDEST
jgi:hypothetical protein